MRPLLTTARLAFYPFSQADLSLLSDLHSDPEVMRYLAPDGRPWSAAVLKSKLDRFVAEHAERGHSKWKVYRKSDGALIGRAGFSVFAPTGELELGFVLRREWWGRGYATECARALLAWLFRERPQITHVIAFTQMQNLASKRVLEKIGMIPTGTRLVDGVGYDFYQLKRWDPPQQ